MTIDMKLGLLMLVLLLVAEIAAGEYRKPRTFSMGELGVSLISFANLALVRATQLAGLTWLLNAFLPTWKGALGGVSPWLIFPIAMLIDDYGNYWVHRMGHTVRWMWRLHKAHHTATNLNVLATMRNNWIFYALIPNTTMAALLYFLGATEAAMGVLGLKIVILNLQHTGVRWDLWLRKFAPTGWLLNGLEKIFVLQDYHHVHHGIGRYGNASSNYANMFVFWDHLHGTSMGSPRKHQDAYGLPVGVEAEPWYEQVWWPLFRGSRRVATVAASAFELPRFSAEEVARAKAVIYLPDGRPVVVAGAAAR
ncbi:sterol desaturase family protein [Variovorax robiniae]|uniref:Sterol desaturase family protein n=1 Tax=Variovorax robiniae TaxID=1836199 RepID=A0ABU8X8U5_9BURK